MKKTDFVFVCLTYVNSSDLVDFFDSVHKQNIDHEVIVVDAFRDEECSKKIKAIALAYGAEYLQIPNKGYSYGNNYGIEHASQNYDYKYLIVSNPDIMVESLNIETLSGMENAVIGPKITNLRNAMQNPMYVKKILFAQKLIYRGLKNENKLLLAGGIVINKIIRKLFLQKNGSAKVRKRVYQVHGCFVLFSRQVIDQLKKVYDENMFLFAEESYLAIKLEQAGIETYYDSNIVVKHKEDGSMKFRSDVNDQLKKSNLYVFEKYYGFQ